MGNVIVNLLPLIVSAAVVPLCSISVLLLLQSQGGLLKSIAFVVGGVSARLVQGALFALVIGAACRANPEPGPRLIVSTLLLVVGILLLVAVVNQWGKQADADAPTPQWMSTIGGLSPLKAFGAGALFPTIAVKQWVFTLSAVAVIGEYGAGGAADVGAYLFFVLATQILVMAPILACAVAPHRSARLLRAAQAWLERHHRAIVIALSLVVGVWFLFKGITGLIA